MSRTVTIANGASLSSVCDLAGDAISRIEMPSAWTAADITFKVSGDGVTFTDYYDDSGAPIIIAADANQTVRLSPLDWDGVRYVKLQSGETGALVNQGADRIITIHTTRAL